MDCKQEEQKEIRRSWPEVLYALVNTHTYSIKKMCMNLKCSRSWFLDHILPLIPESKKIFLSSGYGAENEKRKPNWVMIAQYTLQKAGIDREIREQLWLDSHFVDRLILSYCTASRQTVAVPLELLMTDYEMYIKRRDDLMDRRRNAYIEQKWSEYDFLTGRLDELREEYLTPEGKDLLDSGLCSISRRGGVEPIPILKIPVRYTSDGLIDYSIWTAPHDLKDYGDGSEKIYRELFSRGLIKVVLQLPGQSGPQSQKVYYLPGPEQWKVPVDDTVIIRASVWEEKKAMFDFSRDV